MKIEPLNIWEIDINKTYIIDDDLNVFCDTTHFDEYYFDDAVGVIKDNYETFCENNAEDHNASEVSGKEAIAILYNDLLEMNNYWRDRYYETMKEGENK